VQVLGLGKLFVMLMGLLEKGLGSLKEKKREKK
jgi:hypothetical protein